MPVTTGPAPCGPPCLQVSPSPGQWPSRERPISPSRSRSTSSTSRPSTSISDWFWKRRSTRLTVSEASLQVVGDVPTRHAQAETGAGKAARLETLAEVDQERRHAFVGGVVARQQRGRAQLLAEQAEQVLLQGRHARGQRAHRREREPAEVGGVQGHGVAGKALGIDRIQSDHLAGQVEAKHLLVALRVGLAPSSPCRRAPRRWRGTGRPARNTYSPALERADVLDQAMQLGQVRLVVAGLRCRRRKTRRCGRNAPRRRHRRWGPGNRAFRGREDRIAWPGVRRDGVREQVPSMPPRGRHDQFARRFRARCHIRAKRPLPDSSQHPRAVHALGSRHDT